MNLESLLKYFLLTEHYVMYFVITYVYVSRLKNSRFYDLVKSHL